MRSTARKTSPVLVASICVGGLAVLGFIVDRTQSEKNGSGSSSAPPVPVTSRVESASPNGAAILDAQPLLAVPTDIERIALISAAARKDCCGADATYQFAVSKTEGVELELVIDKPKDPGLDDVKGATAILVGAHKGIAWDEPKLSDVNVAWTSGAWEGAVIGHYTSGAQRRPAQDAAQKLAERAAILLDQYLTGTPPALTERTRQLDAVATASGAGAAKQIAQRVPRFITKVREFGLGSSAVVGAAPDPLGQGDDLIVTVGEGWLRGPKSDRQRTAQGLWQMWAAVTQNQNADSVHIKFVDAAGNTVGGSGIMGGSIEIED